MDEAGLDVVVMRIEKALVPAVVIRTFDGHPVLARSESGPRWWALRPGEATSGRSREEPPRAARFDCGSTGTPSCARCPRPGQRPRRWVTFLRRRAAGRRRRVRSGCAASAAFVRGTGDPAWPC